MLSVCDPYYNSLRNRSLEEGVILDFISDKVGMIKKKIQKLIDTTPDKIKEIERKLRKNGIDVDRMRKYIEDEAKTSKIKNGKIEKFQERLNIFIRKLYANKFSSNDCVDLVGKVALSVGLLAVVFFINTYFFKFLVAGGVSPKIAYAVRGIFIAPILEETAKMISIKHDATGLYFVIFNAAEFALYFSNMVGAGMSTLSVILTRIPTILLHLLTTMIQVDAKTREKPIEGLILGTYIHMLWNTLGVVKKIME